MWTAAGMDIDNGEFEIKNGWIHRVFPRMTKLLTLKTVSNCNLALIELIKSFSKGSMFLTHLTFPPPATFPAEVFLFSKFGTEQH
jgi:hypothetical protein